MSPDLSFFVRPNAVAFDEREGGRVVFNIKANDYRLIALIQYREDILMMRFFGSHEEHNEINAETV